MVKLCSRFSYMERLDIVNRLIQTIAQNTNTIGSKI